MSGRFPQAVCALFLVVLGLFYAPGSLYAESRPWRWIWISALATGEFETKAGMAVVTLHSDSFRIELLTDSNDRVATITGTRKATALRGQVVIHSSGFGPLRVRGGIYERTWKDFRPPKLELIELSEGPYHRILISRTSDEE